MIALYRMFVSTQATKPRLVGLLLLGAVAVVLGASLGADDTADPVGDGTLLVNAFGLALFVPVTTLVFASAVLGEPNEDGTLVYLWLRPMPRWRIVAAALGATLTVTLPVVLVPMVLAAAATGAGAALVQGTLAACVVATVAYAGIFTWLGLRVKRALVWGLAYILIWEGFVARAGDKAAWLAVRAHARSLLTDLAEGPERLRTVAPATAVVATLAAAAAAAALTVWRLRRQDVT